MWQDVRYAVRMLIKTPGFALVAFVAIGLGIGVNATVFGIINTLLLRPLPAGHSDRLARVFTADPRFPGIQATSYPNFLDYAKQSQSFNGITGYAFTITGITRGGETQNALGLVVNGNYFELLEVRPALGRTFLPDEDTTPNGHPVAVVGYKFWKKLGGDTGIVGSTITLNGRAFTVIGVAPPHFTGVDVGVAPDFWVPMAMHSWVPPVSDDWFENRRALFLNIIARLKSGVTIAQAEAEMQTIARRLEQQYPEVNKDRTIKLRGAEAAKAQGLGGNGNESLAANVSTLLLAAAGSILLIVCANVANLLLARASTRQREMAIRLALGAGRGRIVRQLLTESILLALIGGLGGVILAYWLGDVLISLLPPFPVPLALDPKPDARVMIAALALAVISGVVFGLAPALQTVRWDLTNGLRERAASTAGGISRWNLRNVLVVAQIAVSLLLLIGSGLFLKGFRSAQSIDPGFRTQNLAITTIDPTHAGYDKTAATQIARNVLDQVRRNPQVINAALGEWVPLGLGGGISRTIIVEGRDPNAERNRRPANTNSITPAYLDTLGVSLLRGRKLTEADCDKNSRRVAVINNAMAHQFWPNEDPIGRRFRFIQGEPMEVVGIARDFKSVTLGEAPTAMVFLPFVEIAEGGITIFVHTVAAPGPMVTEMHRIVRETDSHIPITYEKTVTQHLAFALWPSWMGALLLGSLGALALVLASMGVYGVMAYSVSQRTRELGIRMALGAQAGQVIRLVLRQGMLLAAIGLVLGLFAAFGSTRLAGSFLYGVNPSDPVIFIVVTLLLAAAAFAACYFPARRALKIDPIIALRFE